MKNYMGIDQGIANVGVVVINDKKEILKIKYIQTEASDHLQNRLKKIKKEVEEIMDEFEIEKVGMESLFATRQKGHGVVKTAMVTGLLYDVCIDRNIKVKQDPATTIKKKITGKGNASKEEVQDVLNENFKELEEHFKKYKITTIAKRSHVTDALAIALSLIKTL